MIGPRVSVPNRLTLINPGATTALLAPLMLWRDCNSYRQTASDEAELSPLLQLRVLRLSLLQNGDVGVGVLPESEEVLISSLGLRGISRQSEGSA
jgi:hypothetical protein